MYCLFVPGQTGEPPSSGGIVEKGKAAATRCPQNTTYFLFWAGNGSLGEGGLDLLFWEGQNGESASKCGLLDNGKVTAMRHNTTQHDILFFWVGQAGKSAGKGGLLDDGKAMETQHDAK